MCRALHPMRTGSAGKFYCEFSSQGGDGIFSEATYVGIARCARVGGGSSWLRARPRLPQLTMVCRCMLWRACMQRRSGCELRCDADLQLLGHQPLRRHRAAQWAAEIVSRREKILGGPPAPPIDSDRLGWGS
jgi:hypothetical protein